MNGEAEPGMWPLQQVAYQVLAVPGAGLCTGCTHVRASALALPMYTLGSTGAGAGGAGGTPMARLAACMRTQQGSAALLPTRQMLEAAAWDN